jgi:hypothetical protein
MSQNRQMERDRDAVRGLHIKLDNLTLKLDGLAEQTNIILNHLALSGKLDG